jgi:ectoine hydroxylase-related dioxygenase (phytanoyl-CoA dioxygenase family)
MREEERYLFDLRGYLVLPNVLGSAEVQALNAYLDTLPWEERAGSRHVHTGMSRASARRGNHDPERGPVDLDLGLLSAWGAAFARLSGHQRLHPYLNELLGEQYRLDNQYAILMKKGQGTATTHELHGGAVPYQPDGYYRFHDGHFLTTLLAVSFALTDASSATGGFCCIPGSHQSHLPLPAQFRQIEQPAPCVQQIAVSAGDVIIFTEALAHGCLAWTASYERRALMFKYCPAYVRWEPGQDE